MNAELAFKVVFSKRRVSSAADVHRLISDIKAVKDKKPKEEPKRISLVTDKDKKTLENLAAKRMLLAARLNAIEAKKEAKRPNASLFEICRATFQARGKANMDAWHLKKEKERDEKEGKKTA